MKRETNVKLRLNMPEVLLEKTEIDCFPQSEHKAVDAGSSETTVGAGEEDTKTRNQCSDPSSNVPAPSETGKHRHSIRHLMNIVYNLNV